MTALTPPEAVPESSTTQVEEARRRAAQRRGEWEAADSRVRELEAQAEREARRQQQREEAERLEAQAQELEAGPVAALRSQKAVAPAGGGPVSLAVLHGNPRRMATRPCPGKVNVGDRRTGNVRGNHSGLRGCQVARVGDGGVGVPEVVNAG